jgi:hypothetical protein
MIIKKEGILKWDPKDPRRIHPRAYLPGPAGSGLAQNAAERQLF